MEQPSHSLRTQMGGTAAQNTPRRAASLVMTFVIEGAVIALLVYGMASATIEKKLQDLTTTVEDKVEAKPPPPPPPDTAHPPPPFVPPPDFQIATEAPPTNAIVSTSQKPSPPPPPAPPPPAGPTTAAEVLSSVTKQPPYPAVSIRLQEEGTVQLVVTVGTDGVPSDVVLAKTSGKPRLDQAAIEYVKAKYRWKPALQGGKAIETRYPLNIHFSLKDVQ